MDIIREILTIAASLVTLISPPVTHIEGVVGQPHEINPLSASENPVDRDIATLVFSGLVRIDRNGQIQPDLAESWEISSDGKEYTFHLRRDRFFHDRTPIKACDIVYTAKRAVQLKSVEVKEVDDYTVKFRLKRPFAPFLSLMSLGIIPKKWENRMKPLVPVGSGPYRISNIERGTRGVQSITLTKFRTEEVGPARIIFKFFEKKETMETAAKLGEIDGFSANGFSWKPYSSKKVPLNGRYFSLIFNLRKREILKDVKFRKTLAGLCPRERIITEALNGNGYPLFGPLQTTWARSKIKEIHYNATPSQTWNEEIKLTFPDSTEHLKTAKILASEWEKAGVKTKLDPQLPSQIKEQVIPQRNFEILLVGQEVSADPDRYSLWHSTQAESGMNLAGYKNMRADRALEEGRTTLNINERKDHYKNFQSVFMEDLPAIFLYQPAYTYHLRKSRGDYNLTGIFTPEERWQRILPLYR